jgi:molecular chaperone Hsp33
MVKDYLHKYLVLDHQARVITVFSTNTVNEYCKDIETTPVSIAAMGRLISATLMMGSMLKGNEKVLVSIDGNGPIGTIKAESDANGHVRAYANNPLAYVPTKNGRLDVASLVGSEGYLSVRKQLNMKEPFIGTCELVSGEIGEDLSYYFGTSEQTPTIVALGVLANEDGTCKLAGGFIIQLLPNASEEAYRFLEKMLKSLTSVSKLIENSKTSDQFVYQLFEEAELIFEYRVSYRCSCSLEKTKMLATQLSEDELNEEINKGEGLDITCNFCQKTYHLDSEDLKEILKMKKQNIFNVK